MYADQIAAARKRSIKDRLNGDLPDDFAPIRQGGVKRQRQSDDKWKHDLYHDDEEPQTSKSIGPRDLRLKLQKKGSQQSSISVRDSGVRDLREKLSGIMHSQPPSRDIPSKTKSEPEVAKLSRYEPPIDAPAPETKKISKPTSSKKTSQQKPESSVDGFLRSLGLEKYSITFQVEEQVDMTALLHMTDEDLKALGVPMGPRKKILLALESKAF
ncbi:ankyrin repeat and SAM domain-containing protein 6-like isoform X1 [Ananas comosus]|uniref:Ankyrin repeat and SAM domain-containing protein 6-like isoform X1 n=1 Tax=Ananas comosus TaxID=4615 RepID=A0A6P5GWB1_ANACO|nr:ankyrin repeat and SAM domain-containing protein 6-like isoform X1 [Ananas comosus]